MTRGPATAHSNLFNHGDHRRGRPGASRGRQLGPSTPQLTEIASWDATEIGRRQSCALRLFPGDISDYELTDHTTTRRRLSELQRIDPIILVLSRGHFANYSKIAVASTQIVTISTDNILEINEFRALVRAQWMFLSFHTSRKVQKDLQIQE
jgi:hypothetical protein